MTSVTLTDLTEENNITLSVDSANNSVAISQTTVVPTLSISLSAAGEVNTISNIGSGAQIYKEKVGTDLRLRTLIGGTGIYAITNNEDITFSLGDVNGEIDTDLVPDGNETRDLGSLTNRWRDLYLSGTSIDLGGASITSDGTIVAIPDNSTAGGYRIITVNDTTDDIPEGTTNQYFTTARFDTAFATKDTDDLTEGTTNVYYTDARARGAVSVTQAAASGDGTLAYNSTTGVLTYTPPDLSGYLTSYTETDPVFTASPASGITSTNITNWNTAYGWGDHSTAGYLTSETTTTLSLATNILTYTDETGTDTNIDLSLYLDDTNLARLTSGTLDGSTGIATFTRDDASTFTVDFSDLLNITFADLSVTQNAASGNGTLSYNNTNGVFTYTPPDLSAYLTSYTETDPIFSASAASGIAGSDITNWNTAYGWGDHSVAGYLTSYTETDPVFSASPAAGITSTNITNWNTAYGWGDHSTQGYLTSFTETNDLTAAVTWANVPDANITQTSVTQHQAALSITESQISDLSHYTDSDVDAHLNTSSATAGQVLSWNGTDYLWSTDAAGIELTDLSVTTDAASNGGTLAYDNTTGVFTFAPADLTNLDASTSLNVVYTAVNKDTVSLAKGTPVYASGGTTSGQTVEVAAADASDPAKMPAIGVLGETLAVDGEGELLIFGQIQGIDTQTPGFSVGDVIYVADGGGFDNAAPTGESNIIQNLGVVTKVHSSNGGGLIEGSGRGAATPNLDDGKIFIGNASNQATTATLDTSIVPEGTNQYYTTARFNADFSTKSTTDLAEGLNLYYTDARARLALSGGTGVTYNNSTGEIAIGQAVETTSDVTFNDVQIDGDLTVAGTTTTINTETVTIADNMILLNSNETGSPTQNAGIEIERGTQPNVQFRWVEGGGYGYWSTAGEEIIVGDLIAGGSISFNAGGALKGDVAALNGTVVLDSGTDGTNATFTGTVTGTVSSIANHDTDALTEGVTNLYYTDARANTAIDARVDATFVENLNIDIDGGTY